MGCICSSNDCWSSTACRSSALSSFDFSSRAAASSAGALKLQRKLCFREGEHQQFVFKTVFNTVPRSLQKAAEYTRKKSSKKGNKIKQSPLLIYSYLSPRSQSCPAGWWPPSGNRPRTLSYYAADRLISFLLYRVSYILCRCQSFFHTTSVEVQQKILMSSDHRCSPREERGHSARDSPFTREDPENFHIVDQWAFTASAHKLRL